VIEANERQKRRVAAILEEMLGKLAGSRIALLGLAFKPETDDIRDAPSLAVAQALLEKGATVVGCDPKAGPQFSMAIPQVVIAQSAHDALLDADACVLLTEWQAFAELDLQAVRGWMKGNVLVDGRNIYDPAAAMRAGFRYRGIGRCAHGIQGKAKEDGR
jgi:UDPglucose 6-dehydrogenase